jgi:hypothetical protein
MKASAWVLFLSMFAAALAVAQRPPPLPPDIDASRSRVAAHSQGSLNEEGRRIFEAINGKNGNTPRLGPPASTALRPPSRDRLNQLLRSANVIGPQFLRSARSCPRASSISNTSGRRTGRRAAGRRRARNHRRHKHDRPTSGLPEGSGAIEFGRACCAATVKCSRLFAKMVPLFGERGDRNHDGDGRLRDDRDAAQRRESTAAGGREPLLPMR